MSPYDNLVWRKVKLKGKALDVKPGRIKKKKKNNKSQDQISQVTLDYLAGKTLFLEAMIDMVQCEMRSAVGSSKKEVERVESENKDNEEKFSNEMTPMQEQVSDLSETLKKLNVESESAKKDKRIETAESHVASLEKQLVDLLLEYDQIRGSNLQNPKLFRLRNSWPINS